MKQNKVTIKEVLDEFTAREGYIYHQSAVMICLTMLLQKKSVALSTKDGWRLGRLVFSGWP